MSQDARARVRAFAAGAACVLAAVGCASWGAAPAALDSTAARWQRTLGEKRDLGEWGGANGREERAVRGWGEQLVFAGDHHELKPRYGLFGPAIVMQLRSDMLALDPRIDEYSPTRQIFDQLAFFIVLTASVIGFLVMWDAGGVGTCVSGVFRNCSQVREEETGAASVAGDTGSLLSTFRGLAGSMTTREHLRYGAAKGDTPSQAHMAKTARSAPGAFAAEEDSCRETAAAGSTALTWAQQMGLGKMPSHSEPNREEPAGRASHGGAESSFRTGLGMEVPWEPTPLLFFVLGGLCQLPLMIALCCYTYFAEMFGAGTGADGLSAFPVIVSVAQLLTAASVATVLREWNWMLKAVLGLLIAVPAILIVPVSSFWPRPCTNCLLACSLDIFARARQQARQALNS